LRIGNLPEKEGSVLRLHHDKFDKTLRYLTGISRSLNFRHPIYFSSLVSSLAVEQLPGHGAAPQNIWRRRV